MSWLFSQALVEEYLGDTCSDGEPSVPLSGNPTQLAYLPPDRMTAFSRLSRFGMTFKPLTADRGEELLTLYLEAFRARTSQQPDEAQGLTEPDPECGAIWQELLARYDRATSSWKTPQCSLLGDYTEFLETWPRWGLMQDGVSYQRQTLVRHTEEIASGSWPTPRSCSAMAATITPESAWAENRFPNLETVVGRRLWPTPRALEIDETYEGYIDRMKRSGNPKNMGKTRPQNLTMAVKMLPTPTCHNSKEGAYPAEFTRNTPTLSAQAGGTLNPTWVEWLMGWPLGWTDLKPLEMDKYQQWQQQHGDY